MHTFSSTANATALGTTHSRIFRLCIHRTHLRPILALSTSISARDFFFKTFLCRLVIPELLVYPWLVYVLAMLALDATRFLSPGFRSGSWRYMELNVLERDGECAALLFRRTEPPCVEVEDGGLPASDVRCCGKYELNGDASLDELGDTERISPPSHCCACELSMRCRLGVGATMVGDVGNAGLDVMLGAFWLNEPEARTREDLGE